LTAAEILKRLSDQGVSLWLDGNRLQYRAPKGTLTEDLRAAIGADRDAIIALLRDDSELDRLLEATAHLPPDKRALLEDRLKQEGMDVSQLPIPHRGESAASPLSHSQKRFWHLWQLAPETPCDNVAPAFRLRGPLDEGALVSSLNDIVGRHEILRTTYPARNGRPVQSVAPAFGLSLAVTDLSDKPVAAREEKARELVLEQARKPFDLAAGPLLRAFLIRLDKEDHILLLATHHIVADGWAIRVLLRELGTLYASYRNGVAADLPDLPIQYADFSEWQIRQTEGDLLYRELSFWRKQLEGAPSRLSLSPAPSRRVAPVRRGTIQCFSLPGDLAAAVRNLAQREGVTLFMLLLGAFQILLRHYAQQDDIIVGTPISNRNRAETENLIGNFANNLLLRSDLSAEGTFSDVLVQVRKTVADAFAHQDIPLEKMIEALREEAATNRIPQLQVMFLLRDDTPEHSLPLPGVDVSWIPVDLGETRLDMSLDMTDAGSALTGIWEYSSEIFDAATIDRMSKDLEILLRQVAADASRGISELSDLLGRPSRGATGTTALAEPVDVDRGSRERRIVAPRDAVELQLVRIWEDVLGVRPVSIHDDFFEVGGYSLLAVQLFAEIEKLWGKSLPLATLLQAPTVDKLAARLRDETWEGSWSSLVPMQPRGRKPPLFLMHSEGGNVLEYRPLAQHLGNDQPVLALQSKGLDGKPLCDSSIGEMAADYLVEVRECQPRGPYFLGGFCLGGLLAVEMARRLQEEEGEEIALVALIDTPTPAHARAWRAGTTALHKVWYRFADRVALEWDNVGAAGRGARWSYSMGRLARFLTLARVRLEGLKISLTGHSQTDERHSLAYRLEDLAAAHRHAFENHTPPPCREHVVLFRAMAQPRGSKADETMGWSELIKGELEIHEIPGSHKTILRQPNAEILARDLKACLEKAQAAV